MKNGQRPEFWAPKSLLTNLGAEVEPNVRVTDLQAYKGQQMNMIFQNNWDQYLSQMTYLRGLDCVVGKGHNGGECALGDMSYAEPWETIDNVIGRSKRFYRNQIPSMPAAMLFSSVSTVESGGKIIRSPSFPDPVGFYNRIFFNSTSQERVSNKKIVDFVLERYKDLKSNPRLGSEDRRRLASYMDHLNEAENRLSNQRCLTCPKAPLAEYNSDSLYSKMAAFNDLIILALQCGATQVATLGLKQIPKPSEASLPGYIDNPTQAPLDGRGVWHEEGHIHDDQNLATASENTAKQLQAILAYNRWHFNKVILDLVKKMDAAIDANGKSLLTNSLLYVGNEMAMGQHRQDDMPVLLMGTANGYIKPGRMIDYMNYKKPYHPFRRDTAYHKGSYPGRPFNQLLVSIMQSMGLTPEEYQRPGRSGYGAITSSKSQRNELYADVIAQHDQVLPRIRG